LVNLSLLAKWKWRLLQGESALWKEVLVEKYGLNITQLEWGNRTWGTRVASRWWKDLVNLEEGGDFSWFKEEVERRVGNGSNTSVWKVAWKGEVPLMVKYPRLFLMSNQQDAMVEEVWVGSTEDLEAPILCVGDKYFEYINGRFGGF